MKDYKLGDVVSVIDKNRGVGKRLRILASKAKHDFFYLVGDDANFITPGWDVKLRNAIHPDGIGIVFGMDGWKNSPGHCMFTRKMSELVDVFPEEFIHYGLDTFLADVSRGVDRFHRIDSVLIEHLHYRNGKAEQDETYQRNRDGAAKQTDPHTLTRLRKKLPEMIDILRKEIERFRGVVEARNTDTASAGDEQAKGLQPVSVATQVP